MIKSKTSQIILGSWVLVWMTQLGIAISRWRKGLPVHWTTLVILGVYSVIVPLYLLHVRRRERKQEREELLKSFDDFQQQPDRNKKVFKPMNYTKISPLGPRDGLGTFESFFDPKYSSLQKAIEANDLVVIDFVVDEKDTIHFEAYHTRMPNRQITRALAVQHFPAGIDVYDDRAACEMAETLFEEYNQKPTS